MSRYFDATPKLTPVNKTAGVVVGRGIRYDPAQKMGSVVESDVPFPVRKASNHDYTKHGFVDLTGFRRGRLTVVGILAGTQKIKWVVRCDCGKYTIRNAKSIKNKGNEQDRCLECRHLAFIKRDEYRRRTGRDADVREY